MTLYEIDAAISALVDPETGEITDLEQLESLALSRNEKIENIALLYKNMSADVDALGNEISALTERKRVAENNAKRLKGYLAYALDGQRFETPRVKCSYRKSSSVQTDDKFLEWAMVHGEQYLRYKDPEADKTAIKEAIKCGMEVPHAQIIETNNITIR